MADKNPAGKTVIQPPPGFNVISEGKANVLVPKGNKVFYNNVQEFNRDLSICVLSNFAMNRKKEFQVKAEKWLSGADERAKKRAKKTGEEVPVSSTPLTMDDVPDRLKYNGLRIFEALSASGLRSIRYYKEIPLVDTIHVNDMDPSAVASIQRNIRYNGLPLDKVIPNQNDATAALYANRAISKELMNTMRPKKSDVKNDIPTDISVEADDPLAWLYQPADPVSSLFTSPEIPSWDAIDLDPYGSASPFLDAAIQAVESGGILAITCTDSSVLCGNHNETCFYKYDSLSMKGPACHEAALRILLHTIESVATKYQRIVTPVLSLSIDFYVRVFVKISTSALGAKFSASKQSLIFHCVRCGSFETTKLGKTSNDNLAPGETPIPNDRVKFTQGTLNIDKQCIHCRGSMKLAGPMWTAPLHDPEFVNQCYEYVKDNRAKFGTHQRMLGMLEMAKTENTYPLNFSPSFMSNIIHMSTPKNISICNALVNAGYEVSETHTSATGLKTNAPFNVLWDIFRAYVCTLPTNELPSTMTIPRATLAGPGVILENGKKLEFSEADIAEAASFNVIPLSQLDRTSPPGTLILSQPSTTLVNFTPVKDSLKKVIMFYPNPEENWGPKAAAGIFAHDKNLSGNGGEINIAQAMGIAQKEKSISLQGTKRKQRDDTETEE